MKQESLVKLAGGILIALVVLAACTPTAVGESAGESPGAQPGIAVVGRGEAFGQPDEAYVNLGVICIG